MSNRPYIKIIADIIGVTVDIFEKSLIYLGGYWMGYAGGDTW
ncbi:PadR family transcriptional regulator [Bacillus luti]|uniref:PadR family transcriptional regulator n=1 Tax=Bacillus luti TaxID=2026191 RepID=A0A7V7V5C3_9BACI|nr:PadR family transcriptional regulator [Bacillus luti]